MFSSPLSWVFLPSSLLKKTVSVGMVASAVVLSSVSSWAMNPELPSPPPYDESQASSVSSPIYPTIERGSQESSPIYPTVERGSQESSSAEGPSRATLPNDNPSPYQALVKALDNLSNAEMRLYKDCLLKDFGETVFSESYTMKKFIETADTLSRGDFRQIQDLNLEQFKQGCDFENSTFDRRLESENKGAFQSSAKPVISVSSPCPHQDVTPQIKEITAQLTALKESIAQKEGDFHQAYTADIAILTQAIEAKSADFQQTHRADIAILTQAIEDLKAPLTQAIEDLTAQVTPLKENAAKNADFQQTHTSDIATLTQALQTLKSEIKQESEDFRVQQANIYTQFKDHQAKLDFCLLDAATQLALRKAKNSQDDELKLQGEFLTPEMLPHLVNVLKDMPYVTSLYLTNCSEYPTDFSPLAGLTNLRHLEILGENDPNLLLGLTNLTSLTLHHVKKVKPLSGLTNLKSLSLNHIEMENVKLLSGLTNLTSLTLHYIKEMTNAEPLSGLTNLTSLSLHNGRNSIMNLRPLSGLTNLTSLGLLGVGVSDFTPLTYLTKLTTLNCSGWGTKMAEEEKRALKSLLPRCIIEGLA